MKNFIFTLLLAFVALTSQAQTISFTSTSVELIAPAAATRSFYDLDAVFIKRSGSKVTVYESASMAQIFYGDTSEVSVTSALIWTAKATKLARWYQKVSNGANESYYLPRRDINYIYRGSNSTFKAVNQITKKLLLESHVDSVTVTGVTGASAKLTYLRNQAYLDASRNNLGLPDQATVAVGAAAGSGATATVTGGGGSWQVTLTTGTTALNSGTLFTLTLPVTYPNGNIPDVNGGNGIAKTHNLLWYGTGTVSTVVVTAQTTKFTDSTAYVFNITEHGY